MSDQIEDRILNAAMVLLGVASLCFVGFFIYVVPVQLRTEAACLKAGYPSYQIDWRLNRYCVKRVDQTDLVVPFERLEAGSK